MVSVVMITYGHENFIQQAIEGVLMQVCNFDVELIVANDCSPDQTDLVIKNIIQNHPNGNWIKYYNHEKNLGVMPNFTFALEKIKGKYVALCDGDDYWTDPLKLQKQVDFLEKNAKYNICGHSVACSQYNFFLEKKLLLNQDTIYSLKEVIQTNPIHTSSFCFRNNIDFSGNNFENFMLNAGIADYPMLVLFAQPNGVFVFKDIMSVYRIDNPESAWTAKLNIEAQKKLMEKTVNTMIASPLYNNVSKKYLIEKLKKRKPNYLKRVLHKIKKKLKSLF